MTRRSKRQRSGQTRSEGEAIVALSRTMAQLIMRGQVKLA